MARSNGVHAFGYNSAESKQIWMKSGALWAYSQGLAWQMWCTRLAENTGRKNCHLGTIAQLCPAIFTNKACIWQLDTSPQYGELRPTNGWDLLASLGQPSKFQISTAFASWLRYCTDVAQRRSTKLQNFAGCLAVCWADTLSIDFRGLLPPNGILPDAKFTLRPSLAFSYTGIVTAKHPIDWLSRV